MPSARAAFRAPGKLILLGEYAVLAGAPALVVAVDRYATCHREPPSPDAIARIDAGSHGVVHHPPRPGDADLPLIRSLLEAIEATEAIGKTIPNGTFRLDSADLYADTPAGRRKLGLGSSAATTVALTAALTAAIDPRAIYALAQATHRRVQGTGSGADIAAASLGGALAYRWLEGLTHMPSDAMPAGDGVGCVEPLPKPSHAIRAVWSGEPASTVALVGAVDAWRARDPKAHAERIAALGFAAAAGIDAWRSGDRIGLTAAADAGREALDALGRDAGVALVTDRHRALDALARRHGAGVKPTGAGGGDLAWIHAAEPAAEAAAAAALAAAGHPVFDFALAPGVHRA